MTFTEGDILEPGIISKGRQTLIPASAARYIQGNQAVCLAEQLYTSFTDMLTEAHAEVCKIVASA